MMATTTIIDQQGSRPLALVNEANVAHREAVAAAEDAIGYALNVGRLLTEAKGGVAHGDWQDWLGEHFEGSYDQAKSYMRAWRASQKEGAPSFSSLRQALDHDRKPRPEPEPEPEEEPQEPEVPSAPPPRPGPPPRPPKPGKAKDGTYGTDLHGEPIRTKEAAEALDGAYEFRQFYQHLEAIRRQVNERIKKGDAWWADFNAASFRTAMRDAMKFLDEAQPFGACPFWPNCEHKNCKACKGTGWVSKPKWKKIAKQRDQG